MTMKALKIKFNPTPIHVRCDNCQTRTETQLQAVDYRYQGETYHINNAEMEVCSRCGTSYYPSYTMIRIEREIERQNKHLQAA